MFDLEYMYIIAGLGMFFFLCVLLFVLPYYMAICPSLRAQQLSGWRAGGLETSSLFLLLVATFFLYKPEVGTFQ